MGSSQSINRPEIGAIFLFQEVCGGLIEEDAKFIHGGQWQKWYSPEAQAEKMQIIADKDKSSAVIRAARYAITPQGRGGASGISIRQKELLIALFGLDGVRRSYEQIENVTDYRAKGIFSARYNAINALRNPYRTDYLRIVEELLPDREVYELGGVLERI